MRSDRDPGETGRGTVEKPSKEPKENPNAVSPTGVTTDYTQPDIGSAILKNAGVGDIITGGNPDTNPEPKDNKKDDSGFLSTAGKILKGVAVAGATILGGPLAGAAVGAAAAGIGAIYDKIQAGEPLTAEEQALKEDVEKNPDRYNRRDTKDDPGDKPASEAPKTAAVPPPPPVPAYGQDILDYVKNLQKTTPVGPATVLPQLAPTVVTPTNPITSKVIPIDSLQAPSGITRRTMEAAPVAGQMGYGSAILENAKSGVAAQAAGTAPSLAEAQRNQAYDQLISQRATQAAGQGGLAARNAAIQSSGAQADLAGQTGMARAAEQAAGQKQLNQLVSQQAAQGSQTAATNIQNKAQASAAGQELNLQSLSGDMQRQMAVTSAQLKTQGLNYEMSQQAAAASISNQLREELAQTGLSSAEGIQKLHDYMTLKGLDLDQANFILNDAMKRGSNANDIIGQVDQLVANTGAIRAGVTSAEKDIQGRKDAGNISMAGSILANSIK